MSADLFALLRLARLVACFAGYWCGKYATLAMLRGCSRFAGSFGGSSPMVSGVDGWPVCGLLAGMAKATSWGLLVAFGALCALGFIGLFVGALVFGRVGRLGLWLCR